MGSLIEFNNSDKIYAILDNIDDFVKEEEEETIILRPSSNFFHP